MRNWFYIVLRTFPFWAIPTGVVLVLSGAKAKQKKILFVSVGIILLISAGIFLFYQGQFKAVPWAHDLINSPD